MFPTLRCLCLLLFCAAPAVVRADCPPEGWDRAGLEALKAAQFSLDDDRRRQRLALGLLDCLADPDPALRDGLAYEGLSTWLRADALGPATRKTLLQRLQPQIAPGADDPDGFRAPFAALVLSEVAEVLYKLTDYYAPEHERTLSWNDPQVGIEWPLDGIEPLLSAKDAAGRPLADCELFE